MSASEPSLSVNAGISKLKLTFFGAGSMAEAIARGLLERGLTLPGQISMINRHNQDRLKELHDRYHVITPSTEEAKQQSLEEADIIFLAMKPKDAQDALLQLKHFVQPRQLVVSLIAGLSIRTIEQLLEARIPVVRTMPNTSSTIGLGATGICYSDSVDGQLRTLSEEIFQSVGITAIVEEEKLLDAVTGVSGSGPAYIYYLMEAMIDAGKKLGLDDESARTLTIQTVLGAANMVKSTGEEPAELRRKVTSPNGTTQAAIELLNSHHVSEAIGKAIFRSAERAAELGAMIEGGSKG
ncbi:pyrroline-5-carboxylate reductase [Paenibacillus sp. GCM10012307]|uniref:Pyrroline-5-carboxylate reductase n=1 Tax=Paenibacillus roseus TaxID=2798579 RepID=A0A934MWW9_9BACL|nr:pyrroline-5-carboxylate reductase [Paenibacillus roseus]MBJ6363582.1 pyrroline-5-carboxylate reductase [Paenibacillus roseus]